LANGMGFLKAEVRTRQWVVNDLCTAFYLFVVLYGHCQIWSEKM